MINILNKQDCCGCSSCAQRCPKGCITMQQDEEGFQYPHANVEDCINCGFCEKVCPVINQNKPIQKSDPYIYKTSNSEVLINSSSGGAFTDIATMVIEAGGVVFGAKFNDQWEVVHGYAKTHDELKAFQGSKYVQSYIGKSFYTAEKFLKEGRLVLFSGTPCQVAALKLFLRKEYDNLLTLDIVCHGVPSPMVWHDYLSSINPENKPITQIKLRSKKRGWARYSYLIKAGCEVLYDDYAANSPYLKGFIGHLYLRPSCHACPTKEGKSHSDITLADCWGVDEVYPEMNDDSGLSSIKLNSEKAKEFCKDMVESAPVLPYAVFVRSNPSYKCCPDVTKWRKLFWKLYPEKSLAAITIINKKKQPSPLMRVLIKIKQIVK